LWLNLLMKVSILIPTLNRLGFLKESLTSVRQQNYANLEILVSDDGSQDGTSAFVRDMEAIDPRVHLVSPNPVPGLFTNVNHLIQHSRGDAFSILGDDDRLLPDFVQKTVGPLVRDPKVVASFCDHWVIDREGTLLREASEKNSRYYGRTALPEGEVREPLTQVMRGSMCMGFSLYRSAIFQKEQFDVSCGGAADLDYAIRAAQLGKLYYVKERLGEYRVHATTATVSRPAYMINGAIQVFRKHSFAEKRYEKMRKRILRSKYRDESFYICANNRDQCLRAMTKYLALRGNPFDAKIVLSLLLTLLPQSIAISLKSLLQNVRKLVAPLLGIGRPFSER